MLEAVFTTLLVLAGVTATWLAVYLLYTLFKTQP